MQFQGEVGACHLIWLSLVAAGPTMLRDLRHSVTGGKQGVLCVLDVLKLGHGQAAENPPLPAIASMPATASSARATTA
jgi:hypothetical protein